MANILTRLGAFRNKAVSHSIQTDSGPQEFRFYPPRMRMLLSGRMRQIIDPISSALAVLFGDRSQDVTRQQEVEPGGKVTTFVQGLSSEIIELRERRRSEAIQGALSVLLNDDTRYQLGELLADSLRDEFAEKESDRVREVRQFMDEIDLPTLVQFVQGYFKALAPVLDASGNSILSDLRGTVKREVARALGKTEAGENAPDVPSDNVIPMPTQDEPSEL